LTLVNGQLIIENYWGADRGGAAIRFFANEKQVILYSKDIIQSSNRTFTNDFLCKYVSYSGLMQKHNRILKKKNDMTQTELRVKLMSFINSNTLEERLEYLNLFIDCFLKIILNHHREQVYSYAERDAKMILQMMTTKLTHLRKILVTPEVQPNNVHSSLDKIIDPTVVASMIRNIYETVCLFHLIFINTKTKEERDLIYYLWVTAGLNYRQRFAPIATSPYNQEKQKEEKKDIESYIDGIRKSDLFKQLNEKDQNKILNKVKEKDYKIEFENGKINFLSWANIAGKFGSDPSFFEPLYTFFSLYSHPSQVAVFQFSQMFNKESKEYLNLTIYNIGFCFSLCSIFLADFIHVFPTARKTFEEFEDVEQIILDSYNRTLRGRKFSINKCWKKLG
jgi:hypothetical protein